MEVVVRGGLVRGKTEKSVSMCVCVCVCVCEHLDGEAVEDDVEPCM